MSAPEGPGSVAASEQRLTFRFDGRPIQAASGQSIGAALHAAGIRVFTRSFKYHRPRGLFCVAGDCPNCLMKVDGRPNVRTCVEPARDGQRVVSQNAWPSLNFDLLRVFDRLDFLLPVGFYYKRFHKPRWAWPIFEHMVRRIAGLGRIDVRDRPPADGEFEAVHVDVCVVGGGPAGLAAAIAAGQAGASVLLLERQARLGGRLLLEEQRPRLEALLASLRALPGVRVLTEAAAFGLYEQNLLGAVQGQRFLKIRAGQVVVCTGARQRPALFHNNDLPGIMLGDGVLRLARLHGVRAGKRAVVLGEDESAQRLASQLVELGIEVAAVVDSRPREAPAGGRWPTLASHAILRAIGNRHLRAVRVAKVLNKIMDSEQEIPCDLLCLAGTPVPANELLRQGGMRFAFQAGRWMPATSVPGLFAAGGAAGTLDLEAQELEGTLRGLEAASALGLARGDARQQARLDELLRLDRAPREAVCCPASGWNKRFLCLCEDVTEKDAAQAVAEGFDGIETFKRYATIGMGPCQGKMCSQAASEACARLTGRELDAVGTSTSRPPLVPVELNVLAADRRHHPVRRTPMHHWHQSAGCAWLDAGQWKRPDHYGDPADEVRAVRSRVGLIDVSTLGKFEVLGPDAAQLLDRVSLAAWSKLKPGKLRYAALCNDEGIVIDDGIGGCLAPDHFYITASTGNAEAVFQWLDLWRTTWKLDVLLLNRTSALGGMNLAGPRSREILARLTDFDLSSGNFPYPGIREAVVAGVPCRLLRVGFVGELGYEIHCATAHALHVWEAVLEAGKDHGIRPFGVEAQRIMRLEKGHIIVGQDTDALSNPFEAGLEWLVRLDKPTFIGKAALEMLRRRGPRSRLVGFFALDFDGDASQFRQLEGCQVVEQGKPAGRVTSARISPTLGKHLGLAWVPEARSAPGQQFLIRWNDRNLTASTTATPFYDPENKQLQT